MDPSAFAAELQRLSVEISSGQPGQVPDLRLPAAWRVESGDQRFEVPAAWLRRALDEARRNPSTWPAERSRLLTQIEALQSEAAAFDAPPADGAVPNALAARAALASVLSAAEFKQLHQQSAMALLRQRLSEWLLRIWQRVGGASLGRRGTAIAFAFIAALVTLAVLTTWVVRLVLRPSRDRRFSLTAPPARRRSARAWARDALKAGDPREAIRCAYRATVCRLEEEGAWRSDETRTPREYLRLLPADHRRRRLVSDVTRRFEEIWYAARDATDDDRAAVLARLEELGCLPAD